MTNGAFQFWTPARQMDFRRDPGKQAALNAQWHMNLNGFTQQGITGNSWNSTNAAGITNYFNPVNVAIPEDVAPVPIPWSAFPGRIHFYFSDLADQDVLSLADTGYQTDGKTTFPPITQDPCSGQTENRPFGPFGPRGWQDEYCEWSVTRNAEGKIVRIDFTCENPEYWNTLWMIDPYKVLNLYRKTLGKKQIKLKDLRLYDQNGKVVIDPSTGRPAYNPLNKWNSGPVSTDSAGGAMHLTSTPNTLQTEIGLASAATLQRKIGNDDETALICCAQYGQPHRNSDPHIGALVNVTVQNGNTATLTNPPGLYIQMPDFKGNNYQTPDGTDPASFWTTVRGHETLNDENGNAIPGNFILHATYEVPPEKNYTVSDITINGEAIKWGGQIARTFLMHIIATGIGASVPDPIDCVGSPATADTLAQPLQLLHAAIFKATATQNVPNPVGEQWKDAQMTLLSNSTLIAPLIEQGASAVPMVLTCATVQPGPNGELPTVRFDGDDITVSVTGSQDITYAIPGNSYPSESTALLLTVNVSESAKLGLRNVFVQNCDQPEGPAMPALLNVVPAGSITTKR